MSLVRDMGKGTKPSNKKLTQIESLNSSGKDQQSQQVFRQHQQNRLQRFDKLILTYINYKQTEVLTSSSEP